MGWRRRLRPSRTLAAFVLTTIAVAVPSAAWYVAGMRKIEREAYLEREEVYRKSSQKAVDLAGGLAGRLEWLRKAEEGRPFYHFQNLHHDPQAAAEGASVSISPLARGTGNPLIGAHFQVDQDGRLTLPTLNDEFPELGLYADEGEQCALLMALEDLALFSRFDPGDGQSVAEEGDGEAHVEVLSERSWRQHLRANALYADIKYGRAGYERAPAGNGRRVEVEVGPYVWRTVPVGGEPSLVALRAVATPAGRWTQGFVVSRETVEQYLENAPYAARFVPLESSEDGAHPGRVVVPVGDTPWAVALDVSAELRQAIGGLDAERDRFLAFFLIGVLGAGLAGLMVVAMVYQSERLAQQRAQFAASAAHELRTPLAGLRLYGEMLAEGLGNPARAREYARRLAGEAERLGRVVTNVLSFTRLERGQLSVDARPGDLGAAVRDAVERQRPALEESGARVELELDPDLEPVRFDRDAVAHVLQNLLDNAEKYTREAADREIRVRLEATPGGAALEVADNGPGVDPALRPRLFDPFTRGENGDAPAGLGLGLVLVKTLAEAQGGDITYRDAPAGGAVFTVTFPR